MAGSVYQPVVSFAVILTVSQAAILMIVQVVILTSTLAVGLPILFAVIPAFCT